MTARELHYLSIAEASRLIASKQLSPVELVAAHIERIEETDARLNSFTVPAAATPRPATPTRSFVVLVVISPPFVLSLDF